jgi:hypothetical protein
MVLCIILPEAAGDVLIWESAFLSISFLAWTAHFSSAFTSLPSKILPATLTW